MALRRCMYSDRHLMKEPDYFHPNADWVALIQNGDFTKISDFQVINGFYRICQSHASPSDLEQIYAVITIVIRGNCKTTQKQNYNSIPISRHIFLKIKNGLYVTPWTKLTLHNKPWENFISLQSGILVARSVTVSLYYTNESHLVLTYDDHILVFYKSDCLCNL